jgi:hypothetical protein
MTMRIERRRHKMDKYDPLFFPRKFQGHETLMALARRARV